MKQIKKLLEWYAEKRLVANIRNAAKTLYRLHKGMYPETTIALEVIKGMKLIMESRNPGLQITIRLDDPEMTIKKRRHYRRFKPALVFGKDFKKHYSKKRGIN